MWEQQQQQLGVVDTAGPIYYYSICIMYVYVVLSAGTKRAPRALCMISHIPRRLQASWNILWIALDNCFWTRSLTRRRADCSVSGGGDAGGAPQGGKTRKKIIATVTPVENAVEKRKILLYFYFICIFRPTIIVPENRKQKRISLHRTETREQCRR